MGKEALAWLSLCFILSLNSDTDDLSPSRFSCLSSSLIVLSDASSRSFCCILLRNDCTGLLEKDLSGVRDLVGVVDSPLFGVVLVLCPRFMGDGDLTGSLAWANMVVDSKRGATVNRFFERFSS